VLKFGQDLPIRALPQAELVPLISEVDRHDFFLMDGTPREHSERGQFIAFSYAELRAPEGRLHIKSQTLAGSLEGN
jgi:hypothetical protein